ncbi:MAG: ABC transporter permease subunit [Sphingobacteriales bacterium]|nr:MAG: ABC transporter permease subunit [Sphingobacteriales bacterium]
MKQLVQPFAQVKRSTVVLLLAGQLALALLLWQQTATGIMPGPLPVLRALGGLLGSSVLWDQVLVSLVLTLKALGLSIAITLLLGYGSLLPLFRGLAQFLVRCRYLTLTGLIFIFTLLTRDGGQLKLSLLIFGMVPFFVTSFLAVLEARNPQEYELCKTLGYSDWQALRETVLLGKADAVLEILRQNFAMAWLMITLVEGLSMSEGGIGTLLIKYNKYNDLPHVLAIQLVLFATGVGFDAGLGALRRWLFPYTRFKTSIK